MHSKIILVFRERDKITAGELRLTTHNFSLSRGENEEWKPNCVGSSECFAHGSQQLSNFKELSVMPVRWKAAVHLRSPNPNVPAASMQHEAALLKGHSVLTDLDVFSEASSDPQS